MTYTQLWKRLTPLYDAGEAQALVRMVLDVGFQLSLADILSGKMAELTEDEQRKLEEMVVRMEKAEPVQYVLGQADFCGLTLHVERGVLIPRPETEELCRWILEEENKAVDILDIGTGSGCIAITLALQKPGTRVTGWDISETALAIARGNAQSLGAEVTFEQRDILASVHVNVNPSSRQRRRQRQLDLIVSNPPYITLQEQGTMHRNVTDYEPGQALFVAGEDPLLFYRAISDFATQALRTGGAIYFEINPLYANELQDMLKAKGFGHIQLKEDVFGKTRFMKVKK